MYKTITKIIFSLLLLSLSSFAAAKDVNVNTATAEEIAEAMSGIGMVKAQAIVDDRKMNGEFKSLEDVTRVKGIGLATIEKNRESVVVK